MLPEKEFECAAYQTVKADKSGIVSIEKKLYSTSPRFAKEEVIGKHPRILSGNDILAYHGP